jgi:hypothetical protein
MTPPYLYKYVERVRAKNKIAIVVSSAAHFAKRTKRKRPKNTRPESVPRQKPKRAFYCDIKISRDLGGDVIKIHKEVERGQVKMKMCHRLKAARTLESEPGTGFVRLWGH